jgi:hypothetical protein
MDGWMDVSLGYHFLAAEIHADSVLILTHFSRNYWLDTQYIELINLSGL